MGLGKRRSDLTPDRSNCLTLPFDLRASHAVAIHSDCHLLLVSYPVHSSLDKLVWLQADCTLCFGWHSRDVQSRFFIVCLFLVYICVYRKPSLCQISDSSSCITSLKMASM